MDPSSLEAENGQSMVEFAIILPLLLLLTFGTIELAMFLSRQITLTGASFLAARAATVGGRDGNNPSRAASEVLGAYADDSGQTWLKSIVDGSSGKVSVETVTPERLVRVTALKKNEQWSGLVLGGSSVYGYPLKPTLGDLGAAVPINREFVKGNAGHSVVSEHTDLKVDYQAGLGKLDALSASLAGIQPGLKAFPGLSGLGDALTFQPLQAVERNPGTQANHQALRYASSDNAAPEKLLSSLDTGISALQAARTAFLASPANTPASRVALQGFLSTIPRAANTLVRPVLKIVEGTIFGTSGD